MTAFRVMMKAAEETYAELARAGTQAGLIDKMQTRKELYELIDYVLYEAFDREVAEEK
jgi:methylisocitrate lyase